MKKMLLAVGADIKNRFLVVNKGRFIFGPEAGDLSDAKNFARFKHEIARTLKSVGGRPNKIVCDLHPGYFSTIFAREYVANSKGSQLVQIQHHHAHIASVMYEHQLREPVIGVSFDGTGYGSDGAIWGGEFFLVGKKGFKRLAHLEYQRMPGGDKVIHEPWRMVLSILGEKAKPFLKNISNNEQNIVLAMLSKNFNSPLTSSAGRLFDAAAALLGICRHASYEAEGPIRLEQLCQDGIPESYPYKIVKHNGVLVIKTKGILTGMARDIKNKKPTSLIATKFHNAIGNIIVSTVKRLSNETGVKKIALSGGVFQNKFLFFRTTEALVSSGFEVFANKEAANDLNIAQGQYYATVYPTLTCLTAGRRVGNFRKSNIRRS